MDFVTASFTTSDSRSSDKKKTQFFRSTISCENFRDKLRQKYDRSAEEFGVNNQKNRNMCMARKKQKPTNESAQATVNFGQ